MTTKELLAQVGVAAKRLRLPGVEGMPAGPLTADELEATAAALCAEVENVQAERDNLRDMYDTFTEVAHGALANMTARAEAAESEVEALRKDAERYRWLREQAAALEISVEWCVGSYSLSPNTADELDAAIDAAKEQK